MKFKKIITFVIAFLILSVPLLPAYAKITPDCGKVVNGVMAQPCDFNQLMILINNVIEFLLFTIATPLAAIAICYSGFLFITGGSNEHKRSLAKGILKNVVIGYVIGLAAWLIVKTILSTLGFKGETFLQ